jgi:radial spoke head protein 4/6
MPVKFQEPNPYQCDNMMRAAAAFEAVGTSMNFQEMYGAMLQMKLLGEDPNLKLKSVRFFGKVLGIFADYYVFEAVPRDSVPEIHESEAGDGLLLTPC